jgi:hypothetical protein
MRRQAVFATALSAPSDANSLSARAVTPLPEKGRKITVEIMASGTFISFSTGEKTQHKISARPLENKAFTLHIMRSIVGRRLTQQRIPSYAPSEKDAMLSFPVRKHTALMHITAGKM